VSEELARTLLSQMEVVIKYLNKVATEVAEIRGKNAEKEKRCDDHKADVEDIKNIQKDQGRRLGLIEGSVSSMAEVKQSNRYWITTLIAILGVLIAAISLLHRFG
jgi:ABC-type Fe3+-citrate transport system substrate-binding protein